jgi:nitroreductase
MKLIQNIYRRFLPEIAKSAIWVCRQNIDLMVEYIRDWRLFYTYSGFHPARLDKDAILSNIMIDYHRLEKGLSLHHPRPGFGRDVALRLLTDLDLYLNQTSPDFVVEDALSSIGTFIAFQNRHGTLVPEIGTAYEALRKRVGTVDSTDYGAAIEDASRSQIQQAIQFDYRRFLHARHSVRCFSDEPVSKALLVKAVEWAQTAPSVCNRQAGRVHIILDPARVSRVAILQKGGVSFKDSIGAMLVVTVDLKRFVSVGERNQMWVDGGIFLMNLLLSLHAAGLGACCLNWCSGRETDRALRQELHLPDQESVIALIAVGNLKDQFQVAKASRLPVNEIIRFY